jgi:hypothetical protein
VTTGGYLASYRSEPPVYWQSTDAGVKYEKKIQNENNQNNHQHPTVTTEDIIPTIIINYK